MHSLQKMRQKYPTLTKSALGEMYGLTDSREVIDYTPIYHHAEQVL